METTVEVAKYVLANNGFSEHGEPPPFLGKDNLFIERRSIRVIAREDKVMLLSSLCGSKAVPELLYRQPKRKIL